jgi:hypothetical protein
MVLYRNTAFSTRLRLLKPEVAYHSPRPSFRIDRMFRCRRRFLSLGPGDRLEDGWAPLPGGMSTVTRCPSPFSCAAS